MDHAIIVVLLAAGFVACLVKAGVIDLKATVQSAKQAMSPYASKPLLTANELEFYQRLVRALPEHVITPQTAMGALVAARDRSEYGTSARSVRATFDRKIVDFCVVKKETFEVLALVELDDRMHRADRDAKRDTITVAAGYRTLRFWSASRPDTQQIRAALAVALNEPPKVHFIQYGGPISGGGLGAVASLFQRPERR